MATERQAHQARERHSALLRSLGAHAIAVDRIVRNGRRTFGVVAFFDRARRDVPKRLAIKSGGKTVSVPLIARASPRFTLE